MLNKLLKYNFCYKNIISTYFAKILKSYKTLLFAKTISISFFSLIYFKFIFFRLASYGIILVS